jgi:serine/threonine protein kinase
MVKVDYGNKTTFLIETNLNTFMFDASEIGLDWKGTLESLRSVPQSKCAYSTADGYLKEHTGKIRCAFVIENTIVDNTFGKLVWVTRQDKKYIGKHPISQAHTKQEAVIQWLCHTSLAQQGLGAHCPRVLDLFSTSTGFWFSMEPVYNAPILDTYLKALPHWGKPALENDIAVFKILCQIAMCCFVLNRSIGFNHRDLKPDNILVKMDMVKTHTLSMDHVSITVWDAPTAVLIDFGFSCLGPGKAPWIQAGDNVLSSFDWCPKVGRDMFMLLVFLLWRKDVRESLTPASVEFLKSSLHLTKERWSQMMNTHRNPIDWIYMLITDSGFQCPALDPLAWLQSCAASYPSVVEIRVQSAS